MQHRKTRIALACSTLAATLALLGGCGGDGGDDAAAPTAAPATASVTTTVVDGAIGNALVCIDSNANGACDSGEVQSRTEITGQVTLTIPAADAGKYPLVAVIDTNAVDADHGPVTARYVLSAPADQTAVISPLTTLVQNMAAAGGLTSAEAAAALQAGTGLATSPFADYTKAAAPTDGSLSARALGRLLVLASQARSTALAASVGSTAIDGRTITQADIDRAVQQSLASQLDDLASAAAAAQTQAAGNSAAMETALAAAVPALASGSGLNAGTVATTVGAANQHAAAPTTPATPAASVQLTSLAYTSAGSWSARVLTSSLARNTPDATNKTRYVDRRARSAAGRVATWSHASDPQRQSDTYWDGSAWVQCGIDHENQSTVRDAQGNNRYTYCAETGSSRRAVFGIAGRTLASVYQQVRDAGYTNISIADAAALGSATFPDGAQLFYQSNTGLTMPVAYLPTGRDSPAGSSNIVTQYSAAVAEGGTASAQPAGTACNASELRTTGTNATALEALVAAKPGKPCVFGEFSFTYQGTTYRGGEPDEVWAPSTLFIGKVGSAPVNSGTAPGFYSGNTLLRVAFGAGNGASFYACKERFSDGATRNCTAIGSTTWRVETLGDARVLSFASAPAQAAALTFERVFVERGGNVFFGYRSKPATTQSARFNSTATRALLNQLGVPVEDPEVPLALTAWSYQGTWDLRLAGTAVTASNGTTLAIGGNGNVTCTDKSNGRSFACTLTVTDPATGAFRYSDADTTATGSFAYLAQTASGTFTESGVSASFVGGRR